MARTFLALQLTVPKQLKRCITIPCNNFNNRTETSREITREVTISKTGVDNQVVTINKIKMTLLQIEDHKRNIVGWEHSAAQTQAPHSVTELDEVSLSLFSLKNSWLKLLIPFLFNCMGILDISLESQILKYLMHIHWNRLFFKAFQYVVLPKKTRQVS